MKKEVIDKEILKLIEESKIDYDEPAQKAEFLKRNKVFRDELRGIKKRLGKKFFELMNLDIKELTRISKDNILLSTDFPNVNIVEIDIPIEEAEGLHVKTLYYGYEPDRYDPISEMEQDSFFNSPDLNTVLVYDEDLQSMRTRIKYKFRVLERYFEKWKEFCSKWNVDPDWKGELSNLSRFQGELVNIGQSFIDLDLPIVIKIGIHTTIDDIKKRWDTIEAIQSTICKRVQKSRNFGRDLCWYRLKKEHGLSYGKIAKLWIKYCPEDIDQLVIKRLKREERAELGEEDALALLKEIYSDSHMDDLRIQFEEERKNYIDGPYSPFVSVIKHAVKSMDKKIQGYLKQESLFTLASGEK